MPAAEIVAIGSEILQGEVLDTNSHWLCSRLASRGATVRRITVLPDEKPVIAEALREAVARRPRLLLTTGGLGPTEDDRTLQAVAEGLGRRLRRDRQAYEWVQQAYREMAARGHVASAEMTPARQKMACLPEGGEPLPNDVGAAPGVVLRVADVTIVCLPGVPDELTSIYDGALRPILGDILGPGMTVNWRVQVGSGDETELAPILGRVADAHPAVYIKSRPRRFGAQRRFLVTLTARAAGEGAARDLLDGAWTDLQGALRQAGIPVLGLQREVS